MDALAFLMSVGIFAGVELALLLVCLFSLARTNSLSYAKTLALSSLLVDILLAWYVLEPIPKSPWNVFAILLSEAFSVAPVALLISAFVFTVFACVEHGVVRRLSAICWVVLGFFTMRIGYLYVAF